MRPVGNASGRRRPQDGFTLVELLVVMAIISILAALLLPALRKAMGAARTTACAANLKQMGIALQMYAEGFSGWLPTKYYSTSAGSKTWAWALMSEGDLLPAWDVLHCPEARAPKRGDSRWTSCWNVYGMRKTINLATARDSSGPVGSLSGCFLYTDSIITDQPAPYPEWYAIDGHTAHRIHLRHDVRANVWYADSHVSCAGASTLATFADSTWNGSDDILVD